MKYHYGETDVWGIPGGSVHSGESLTDTLRREVDEELGISIDVGGLACLVETPTAANVERTLHCVFVGSVASGIPELSLEHTSALSVSWIDLELIETLVLYPPINDIVKQALSGSVEPGYLGIRERQWY